MICWKKKEKAWRAKGVKTEQVFVDTGAKKAKDGKLLDKNQMNKLLSNGEDDGVEEDGYNSEDDPNPVVNFDNELHYIKELKGVDIVFVVDCTSSMKCIFKGVKRFIRKLVWDASKCLTQYLSDEPDPLQVGLVMYRDHPPQDKTFTIDVHDLSGYFKKFRTTVMKMEARGGGDGPEAVLDGLDAAVKKISWRPEAFHFIYHILDSPPHGKIFSDLKDGFPDGCPCNIDYEEIFGEIRTLNIEYNIVKLSSDIDKMINVFGSMCKIDVMIPDIQIDANKKVEQTD